jgi:serine/threonine protein kinase/Tol biopolymer transport system component
MGEGIKIGSSIGHYRIVSRIGAGGMGEVYRAHDARLDREVAIKVLPADFAKDEDRLKRFEQEAKATSALNHPNILTVYDIGEHDGAPFIVAELLEGEELRARLDEGAIQLRKVTEYAQQIVSGLSAAHEKGIVHRDLKPENLFITVDERVKILDFGLAKLSDREASAGGTSGNEDATRKALTNPGVVMGTAGYMSPEQVRGTQIDHRSDIFSFGVILYEMLTGRRAFQEESLAETMSAIVKDEPPEMTESNPNISPSLERIVRRCLEKKPDRRFQSTADLGFALESLSAPTSSSGSGIQEIAVEHEPKPRPSRPLLFGLGLLLLAVGASTGILAYGYFWKAPMPKYEQLTFRRGFVTQARFSPDGQSVVYGAEWGGKPGEIFTTRTEAGESKSLDLKDADVLSVSSSGELAILIKRTYLGQLIYKGTLARVPILGGTPREILEDVQQADWSPDGKELAIVRWVDGKNRLEFPIGKVLYETDGYISHPRVSPKGDRVAFMNHKIKYDNRGTVEMVDLAGNRTVLTDELPTEEGLAWSADGSEIWFTASKNSEPLALFAVSPSGRTRDVLRVPSDLWLHDISRDGRVLLTRFKHTTDLTGLAPGDTRERDLSWLDAGGLNAFSADGKSFVFTNYGQGGGKDYTIYLGKTDGSAPVRIGDGQAWDLSADGKWVISELFSQDQVIVLPTGAGEVKKLDFQGIKRSGETIFWLPDNKQIIFVGNEAGRPKRTFIKDVNTGDQRPLTPEGVIGSFVSPDERSFVCIADGKTSICSFDENTPPRPIVGLSEADSIRGWTADGRLYTFVSEGGMLKVSRLDTVTGRKEPFKDIALTDTAGMFFQPVLDITPDGKSYMYQVRRYLMDLNLAVGLK